MSEMSTQPCGTPMFRVTVVVVVVVVEESASEEAQDPFMCGVVESLLICLVGNIVLLAD